METITQVEALARLRSMTAASEEPALTDDELGRLEVLSRVPDAYGLTPADVAYVPTYDLNRGAAEGWLWKAGKVSGLFDISDDGSKLSRSQASAMCREQAALYTARIEAIEDVEPTRAAWPWWVVNL